MKKSIVLVLLFFSIAWVSRAEADQIVNGNFASVVPNSYLATQISQGAPWINLGTGSTDISGWTVSSGNVDYITTYWQQPPVGGYSIDLNGYNIGAVSQTISTVVGQQYQVSFWLAGNPAGPPPTKTVQVSFGDLPSVTETFNVQNTNTNSMNWVNYTLKFTADSTSTPLTFSSSTYNGNVDNSAFGPALGAISVTPTPIPAAAWLLGSGLLGLIGIRRKVGKA